jgi:hypothetical protein
MKGATTHWPLVVIAVLALLIALALTVGGGMLAHAIYRMAAFQQWAREAMLGDPIIWWLLVAYIVLIAIPFVPGAELGLLLIAVFGPPIVGYVYLATVLALVLSFTMGRCLPDGLLERIAARLDAARLLHRPGAEQTRLGRWADALLRHRCCSLAVLINTPGNSILGGGGGIAMAAGASRLMNCWEFVPTVLVAVSPVPLLVLISDWFF